ncbi:hypothetical protein J6590_034863 [Homalodisca vitripennis]|nr:hypothetical protein J6590_102115 [Homalodisca vitripennis]KAG8292670.1 hypothetical protein J6590_034863 [Homalodisca vitripennis]
MYGIDLGTSYVRMAEFSRRRAQPVAISWDDDEDDSEKLVRIEGMNIHIGDDISWPLFSESNTMAFVPEHSIFCDPKFDLTAGVVMVDST